MQNSPKGLSVEQIGDMLKKLPIHSQIELLNELLSSFAKGELGQYHLKIPEGTVTKIDYIRDTDFSYLKDSVYKSNISYLIQQINFQTWIYKLFRPTLSLENGFFYMLQTQMGIMVETLLAAILYDPFIKPEEDRSLGDVKLKYSDLGKTIQNIGFAKMLRLCREQQILPLEILSEIDQIRDYRNEEIHLHGIDFRIYKNFDFQKFKEKYGLVTNILKELAVHFSSRTINHSATNLREYFFGYNESQEVFEGTITFLQLENSYGLVKIHNKENIYFNLQKDDNFSKKQKVFFRFFKTENGLIAIDVKPI